MFVRDPFDIAPGASRHTPASWLALAAGLFFLLCCALLLERNVRLARTAEIATEQARRLSEARVLGEAAARIKRNDPAALERIKAQQALQRILRRSWSGLFDALEAGGREVDGRVAIVSLSPVKTQANAAEVGLTALAVSNQVMVAYIQALQRDPHVRQVQLSAQEPANSGGAEVIRFQVTVLWDPVK